MKRAHGRYIAFLDSDDAWFPNKLTEQIPLFRDEQTAIVYTNYEKMSESGLRHNRIVVAPQTADYERLLKGNVIGNLTGIYGKNRETPLQKCAPRRLCIVAVNP